jgi:hypothetical protein
MRNLFRDWKNCRKFVLHIKRRTTLVGIRGSANWGLRPPFSFCIFASKPKTMASVERVYRAVKDIANKDQRGFITPAIFNEFAGIAQMNVYNRLFEDMGLSVRMRRNGADAQRQFAKAKITEEDLSTFSKKATLALASGVVDKPADFARVISITTPGRYVLGQYQQYQVQVVYNTEHIDRILNSDLSKPTSTAPVALIGDKIEVFPNVNTSVTSIVLRYYKLPQGIVPTTGAKTTSAPTYGYTSAVPGVELYSAANSVDFELPEQLFAEIVTEILTLVGVNLRDNDVFNYGATETAKDEAK